MDTPLLPETRLFIGGTWRDATGGTTFTVIAPATEQPIAEVAAATDADVDAAVAAARAQSDGGPWSRTSGGERAKLLWRIADLVEADAERLAHLEAIDVGRPIAEPRNGDVPNVVETFRHYAALADMLRGEAVPVADYLGRARHSYTRREPVGVVAAITPWNAPTMIAAWKIAPALAAGCTLVVKPPQDACLSTLRLVELIAEAGAPAGVINAIPGRGSEIGIPLVTHRGVDKVSFTGSPEVGHEIAVAAGGRFKRLTLELGGKSPQLVFPDADLDRVFPTAAASLFANQGEVCAAATRVFVHERLRDEVVERLADAARAVRVGDPLDPDTTMGALINQRRLDTVLHYVESGRREGAELVAGGSRLDRPGYFVEPTVFVGSNDMTIAREEIFGPVGTVIPFSDPDEAIRQANDSAYGLTAVVWTEDLGTAHRTAAALNAGVVWVNGWGVPDPRLPWGGVKTSGVGRELGLAGLHAHTEEKLVNVIL